MVDQTPKQSKYSVAIRKITRQSIISTKIIAYPNSRPPLTPFHHHKCISQIPTADHSAKDQIERAQSSVLHGHGCGCRCPTRVRVFDSLEFSGTRQITLGIRHRCRNPTWVRGIRLGKKIKTQVSGYNTDNHATPAYMTQAGRQTFAPDLKFDRTTEPLKF